MCIAVVCVLVVSTGLVAGQIYHILTVSMTTPGNSSCPPDRHVDAIRGDISRRVSGILTNKFACGTSGWRQVAYLNMTDPDQTCPTAWRLYEQDSVRACGRKERNGASCDSVEFTADIDGHSYTHVCGRIHGFGYASPDSGRHVGYTANLENAINEPYLDGVSITYGTPRKHIWSFYGEVVSDGCCSQTHIDNTASLGFIGDNLFCDTGNPTDEPWGDTLFTEHPLWDGKSRCSSSATCCTPHSGPWFYATLPLPTIAAIEVRICLDQSTIDEDIPLELIEIYVK